MGYEDASTQTVWAGLMQRTVRPESLLAAPQDTSTPPAELADMVTDKSQFAHKLPEITHSHHGDDEVHFSKPTLIERRQGRPGLVARISLPTSELNDEVPLSPPPTHAVLSPLPEANTRHAGHTPLIPRARSPSEPEGPAPEISIPQIDGRDADIKSLEDDEALSGSLVLPTDPEAANDDPVFISLNKLDKELSKIARQQRHLRGEFSDDEDAEPQKKSEQEPHEKQAGPPHVPPPQSENQPPQSPSERMRELPGSLNPHSGPLLTSAPVSPPQAPAHSPPQIPVLSLAEQIQPAAMQNNEESTLSRKGSADSNKSTATDDVDGVRMKTPPSNFGAPLGHL